jgi:hypothetical protein
MEKQEPKKAWVTPELIVLVRSKPEEAVLSGCKVGAGTAGPGNQWASACLNTNFVDPCFACEVQSGS